jgi:hypothetical protein
MNPSILISKLDWRSVYWRSGAWWPQNPTARILRVARNSVCRRQRSWLSAPAMRPQQLQRRCEFEDGSSLSLHKLKSRPSSRGRRKLGKRKNPSIDPRRSAGHLRFAQRRERHGRAEQARPSCRLELLDALAEAQRQIAHYTERRTGHPAGGEISFGTALKPPFWRKSECTPVSRIAVISAEDRS